MYLMLKHPGGEPHDKETGGMAEGTEDLLKVQHRASLVWKLRSLRDERYGDRLGEERR